MAAPTMINVALIDERTGRHIVTIFLPHAPRYGEVVFLHDNSGPGTEVYQVSQVQYSFKKSRLIGKLEPTFGVQVIVRKVTKDEKNPTPQAN
jgi:hypothetical protein